MTQNNPQVPWTDEQWARINQVIHEEASRARIAARFLPLFGPLPGDADFIRAETIHDDDAPLSIGDRHTLRLATLAAQVQVRSAQSADPEMRSVLALFRRAANVLARLEDAVVFRGLVLDGSGGVKPGGGIGGIPPKLLEVHGGEPAPGLWIDRDPIQVWPPTGHELVRVVSEVIGDLEAGGHFGPFAAVFGQKLFLIAQTPDDHSLVLPQDRIIPFLGGGTLLRSSTLDDVPFPSKLPSERPWGSIVFKAQPTRGKTINLNGTVIKWGDGAGGTVGTGADLNAAMEALVKFLKDNNDGDSQILKCTYAPIGAANNYTGVKVTYRWPGLDGFSFTLAQDDPAGSVTGPTLSGTKVPGGVIVALGGAPIELVVAQDMSLQFLQLTKDPYFLFRVREKIALRIKERKAIRGVYIRPKKITLTPNQGRGPVPITIKNVYDAISVSVDGGEVEIDTRQATEIAVTLPGHAQGSVTVKVTMQWGSAEAEFNYT
jgi:uncharacterized linocin/CFP29 family protein